MSLIASTVTQQKNQTRTQIIRHMEKKQLNMRVQNQNKTLRVRDEEWRSVRRILWEQPAVMSTVKMLRWMRAVFVVGGERVYRTSHTSNKMNACLADSAGSHESSDNMSFQWDDDRWRLWGGSEIGNAVFHPHSHASTYYYEWTASHADTNSHLSRLRHTN